MVNAEHYQDPTAEAAIARADRALKEKRKLERERQIRRENKQRKHKNRKNNRPE